MLIWEVLETLFRWCIAGGSGDYGGILGDWDLVLVSSLGISLLSGCGMNSLCLTCHHDVLWHQRPSVGGAKDGRLTSLRLRKYKPLPSWEGHLITT